MRTLYDFDDYKAYLSQLAGPKGARNGFRSGLARAAGCNLTYVSQVLHGPRDFSLEQAEPVSSFLSHSAAERHHFLLLVQKARAGTPGLRAYCDEQLRSARAKRLNLKARVGAEAPLNPAHQYTYYSSWAYAAIHVALSVPELQTPAALARYFNLRPSLVKSSLAFLTEAGLAVPKGSRFEIGPKNMHLGNDSRNILRHHANWRTRALASLEREDARDLHYSAAVTLSRTDALRIKEKLVAMIQEVVREIGASKEEEAYALGVDFFSLAETI